MNLGTMIQTGVTCGIEYETDNLTPQEFRNSGLNGWRTTTDASIQTDTVLAGNILKIEPDKPRGQNILANQRITIGTEIVSPILDSSSEEFFGTIINLTNFLMENGDTEKSDRSGIHFHISFPGPRLSTIKRIIQLGAHYEKLFFKVGGLGYRNRVENNDATYARPITKYGPTIVVSSVGYAQCLNINDAIKAETLTNFWEIWGDMPFQDTHYTPVRYTWLNLFPLFPGQEHRGTVEFRIWNKTLNPDFIFCAFMLCRGFLDASLKFSLAELKGDNLLEENSIYDYKDDNTLYLLEELCELSNINPSIFSVLRFILERSPMPHVKDGYVYTHLLHRMNRRFWGNGENYKPQQISGTIRDPNYVDVHLLRGERR